MGKRTNLRLIAVAVMLVLVGTGSVRAFDVVKPGYDVEVFSIYSKGAIQGLAFDNEGNLYASHRANKCIWKITPDGSASEFASGFEVRGLVFGGGTAFGNYLYTPDGQTYNSKIRKISLAGSVANFASFNPPKHCPSPIAIDTTGNYAGNMFSATSGQDRTYQVSSSGVVSLFADFPGWRDGGGPSDIIFDDTGNYGNSMIMATCFTNSSGNEYISGVWKISPSGHAARLIPETMYPAYMDIDRYGDFEGKLYVTTKYVANGPMLEIWSVEPNGSHSLFATTDTSFRDIIFSSDGVMYISEYENEQTTIYKVYPARNLIDIEVVGPSQAAENSSIAYKAIAHYDAGNPRDVTASAQWSVEPNDVVSITAGLLTTERIDLPTDVTVTAQYSQGDVNKTAEKDVSIFAICPSGSALEFDGIDDYVDIPDSMSLRLPSTLTVEAWVKPIYDGRDYYVDTIVVKGENVGWGPHFNYRIAMENQNLYTWGVTRSGTELFFHGGTPIYDNWQHLAVVADGTQCIAYINGIEVASREASGPYLTFEGYPLQIGGHAITNARWFSGMIDEVRIWNSAKTVNEIRVNMHRKPDIGEPNLVGYWNFDEGKGGTAKDSSGNGNNGIIVGATWTDSIPLVGDICGLEGIVERNLSDVWDAKVSILEQLYEAIAQEQALLDYMDEKFAVRDFGDTSKGNVAKAKQKIHSAIQTEEQAGTAIDQSLDKIDEALEALGIESNTDGEFAE